MDYGDSILLTFTFTTNSVAADPTAVTLYVRSPDGTSNTYTYAGGDLTKSSTGVYTYLLELDQEGTWIYKVVGTGSVVAASPDTEIVVEPSIFGLPA